MLVVYKKLLLRKIEALTYLFKMHNFDVPWRDKEKKQCNAFYISSNSQILQLQSTSGY